MLDVDLYYSRLFVPLSLYIYSYSSAYIYIKSISYSSCLVVVVDGVVVVVEDGMMVRWAEMSGTPGLGLKEFSRVEKLPLYWRYPLFFYEKYI